MLGYLVVRTIVDRAGVTWRRAGRVRRADLNRRDTAVPAPSGIGLGKSGELPGRFRPAVAA